MRVPIDHSADIAAADGSIAGAARPGAIERLLERGTARLDAAALQFRRGTLASLRLVVVTLGIFVLMVWAAREIGLRGSALGHWSMLPGALLCGLSVFVYALRFRYAMSVFEVELGVVQALRISTLSLFYHCFLPLSAGADLTKFIKLRRIAPAGRPLFMAGGIVLDHLIGLICLLAMTVVLGSELHAVRHAVDPVKALLALLTVTLLVWLFVHRRVAALASGDAVLERISRHKGDLLAAAALSVLMQCLTAAAVYAGSRGWQLDVGYLDILFVLTASFVLQAIPLNLVGVGAADLAGAALYVGLGLPPAAAVLLVSLMYAYRLLIAAIGGLWDLLPD